MLYLHALQANTLRGMRRCHQESTNIQWKHAVAFLLVNRWLHWCTEYFQSRSRSTPSTGSICRFSSLDTTADSYTGSFSTLSSGIPVDGRCMSGTLDTPQLVQLVDRNIRTGHWSWVVMQHNFPRMSKSFINAKSDGVGIMLAVNERR